MIVWTQGKTFDDYTQQLLTLLGQHGIPYEAIRIYVPDGSGSSAYWDYHASFKNHQGLPTSVLIGRYARGLAEGDASCSPASVIDMARAHTDPPNEIAAREESWRLSYTYTVQPGPFGVHGTLRPNGIKEAGIYGGYATPPATFGTPPPIPPPPMVEQPKPAPPAPVIQDSSGAPTPSSAGINALPGTGPLPATSTPANPPSPAVIVKALKAMDPETAGLIKMLMGW